MIIEYISGTEGNCLAINNYRIAGPKPWGGGYTICKFGVDKEILDRVFGEGDVVMEVVGYELFINGKPTQGMLTDVDLYQHVKKLEERRKRFLKDTKHRHDWSLCRRNKWKISGETYKIAVANHEI